MFDAIAKPFGLLLMWLYELVRNYGLAIILFAIIIRTLMLPFQMKSKRGMLAQARLEPRRKELEKKYAGNKEKYQQELMKMYKEEGVNQLSGCLWGLLPLPIWLALYRAITFPITIMMGVPAALLSKAEPIGAILARLTDLGWANSGGYYEQISQTNFISAHWEQFKEFASDGLKLIDFKFLGLDLGAKPEWQFFWKTDWSDKSVWLPGLFLFLIPVLSAASAYLSTVINRRSQPQPEGAPNMGGMMLLSVGMSLYFGYVMPASLGIYWIIGQLVAVLQDYFMTKYYTKKLDREGAERDKARLAREAEIERKRAASERLKAEGAAIDNPNISKKKQQTAEKLEKLQKQQEWERKNAPPKESAELPASQVGGRKFARGRAYTPERYGESAQEAEPETLPDAADSGGETGAEIAVIADTAERAPDADSGQSDFDKSEEEFSEDE
ncbi:MAG: membrane protein insertase YidC [Oscillospiraceae bacterium]|jgi:YidC/Oxa1 family membrane protein insertase|nr:membrane protein insertase YidC [Oscillospiraceae bacterium]